MLAAIASAALIVGRLAGRRPGAARRSAGGASGPGSRARSGSRRCSSPPAIVAGWGGARGTGDRGRPRESRSPAGVVGLRRWSCRVDRPAALAGARGRRAGGAVRAIPFIAAGDVGILGVGLVNDDMASHLLLADWIDERFRPEPVLIDQGYPLGPHALVAGLATVLHASSIDVFAGLTLAIPALTALVAFSALDGLATRGARAPRRWSRFPTWPPPTSPRRRSRSRSWRCSCSPSRCCWRRAKRWRDAIALGVIAAGVAYVYSFPGLAWLAGVAGSGPLVELWRNRPIAGRAAGSGRWSPRSRCWWSLVAAGARPAPRLRRLPGPRTPTRPTRAGSATFPASSRRSRRWGSGRRASSGSRPAPRACPRWSSTPAALFALVALALALPRWIRRHGPAIPAALAAAAVLYLFARGLGTVYTSAKALSIAAPLVALVTLGGLLAASARPLRWPRRRVRARRRLLLVLDPAPGAGRSRPRTPTSSPGSGRWSRVRSCSSSAATTSSSTSSGARSPTPTCATSTTPTSSSPTSSSPRWARSSTSTRSPRGRWPGSRTCSRPGPATPAARRPATG